MQINPEMDRIPVLVTKQELEVIYSALQDHLDVNEEGDSPGERRRVETANEMKSKIAAYIRGIRVREER